MGMAVIRAAVGTEPKSELISMECKLGRPTLKQSTFDWGATDQYTELSTFRLEASTIFQKYNTNNAGKVHFIKNWLGRQGLQFLYPLTQADQESCRPLNNETFLSLQHCELSKQSNEMKNNAWRV